MTHLVNVKKIEVILICLYLCSVKQNFFSIDSIFVYRSFLHVHLSGTYPTALTSQATEQVFSVLWTHLAAVRHLQGFSLLKHPLPLLFKLFALGGSALLGECTSPSVSLSFGQQDSEL